MNEIPELKPSTLKADYAAFERAMAGLGEMIDEMCELAEQIKASVEKDHETRGIRVK